ncbi:hypothetical protein F2P81_017275 [Scophthalmus maximus]|uniref:Ras-related protein Rab-38-like n=1 Tax=Scophthalmus maximus TaxID=52904 RepID=A0A6A4SHX2_SCOMX|nr:hypothetical protein F2P81_017275 [Scophthalmus maximus]
MQNNHHKEHLYKILVIGDLGVGKTSIIKRYVHHNFSPNYRATIGVDFALKVLNWDQETVRLQLWDIAEMTRRQKCTRMRNCRRLFSCQWNSLNAFRRSTESIRNYTDFSLRFRLT